MKQFLCLACDHVWMNLEHNGCPKCGSQDVTDDGEEHEIIDWEDGHFEGDFPGRFYSSNNDCGD